MNKTVLHSGKGGDLIASLATLYEMHKKEGSKFDFILDSTGTAWRATDTPEIRRQVGNKPMAFGKAACQYLQPLIAAQPYINSCTIADTNTQLPDIDIDFNAMRAQFLSKSAVEATRTNLEMMYKFQLGLPLTPSEKWLFVDAKQPPKPLIVARSTRYLSAHLWLACRANEFQKYGCFIGTPFEHKVFEDAFDVKMNYLPTKSALESAQYIAGSEAFIAPGNLHYWIALGVGHTNVINELCVDVWTTYYQNNPRVQYIQGGRCFT